MEFIIGSIVFIFLLMWLGIKKLLKIFLYFSGSLGIVLVIYIVISNLSDSDITRIKNATSDNITRITNATSNIKCEFISCPGDRDFTGKGSYIEKFSKSGSQCERSGSFKNGVLHGQGKQVCKNDKGKTYLVFEGNYNNGKMWTGYYSGARSYTVINGIHLDPVVIKQKEEQAKKAQRRKSIDALVRASGRISDMSNAPGTRQVTLGDFGTVLNEELNGRGNSRSNRKDTDWDWDYLKASREWRCRGIQTGQFANNYNCRNDRKDDDRWPTK